LGLLIPRPSKEVVTQLCEFANGKRDVLTNLENALGEGTTPVYAEYQYLQKGFGYGVYKEGFDIVFHYSVGTEENKE
jgi:hypothetical protein